jgi:HAE1 family hydrophobic/amphiphilic exporter-1
MKKLIKFSLSHPVTLTVLSVAIIIFGFIAYNRLPINLLPEISYPTITVKTDFPGASPQEVENLITKPLEEAVGVVSNVVKITSYSRAEVSEIIVEFSWGTNMDFASLNMREKIDAIRLPDDAKKPILLKYDPSSEPIMRIGISSNNISFGKLRYYAEKEIEPEFETLEGVAAAKVSGGIEEEIHVDLDEEKLQTMKIPISLVEQRLSQENVNISAGILKEGETQYLIRTLSLFKNLDDIREIIITYKNNAPIKVKDIAKVYMGAKDRKVITYINGKENIEIAVYKVSSSNTVRVANDIRERIKKLNKIYKEENRDINFKVLVDQSHFIKSSIDEVLNTALLGGLLAIIILFLFLKNIPSTLIISLSIPISIMISFFLFFIFNVSLNIMSLGGLALGIGMLLDSSIVVLEAVNRKKDEGLSPYDAAFEGTAEVAGAVTASTLTTISVFLPVIFIKGVAGQLFRDQALAVIFSLTAALFVSLTLIPMLFPKFKYRGEIKFSLIKKPVDLFNKSFSKFQNFYSSNFDLYLKKRKLIILSAIALFILSSFYFYFSGANLIPKVSQGELRIDLIYPPGTSVKENGKRTNEIYNLISDIPSIDYIYMISGKGKEKGTTFEQEKENLSQMIIKLKKGILGSKENKIADELRKRIATYPEVQFNVQKPMLFSIKSPVEYLVFTNDLEIEKKFAKKVLNIMKTVKGLVNIRSSILEGSPEIQIYLNRHRLARTGLTVGEVANILKSKIEGGVSTKFYEKEREIDIRVRLKEKYYKSLENFKNIHIETSSGESIPLRALANIKMKLGPSEIYRENQQRAAKISAELKGISLSSAIKEINKKLKKIDIPAEISVKPGGQSEEKNIAFNSMIFAMLLSIFLVYLVMAAQFESFLHPLVIIFTIPFGIIGVAIFLVISFQPLNVVVLIAMVILAGIVVNNAIVLLDYVKQLRQKGVKKIDALKSSGEVRFRPIWMTTFTTILGLIPMALDFGEGFEIRVPLAITLIGGLLFGTLLTLVLIPIIYDYMDKKQ